MLENRLRAVIRSTDRGKEYKDEVLTNAINTYLADMSVFLNLNLLIQMPDTSLLANYLIWEMLATRCKTIEERLVKIGEGIKITLLPNMDGLTEQPVKEATNVVPLFNKTIH